MKKNIKRFIPAMIAISILGTSAVFAKADNSTNKISNIKIDDKDDKKLLAVKLIDKNGIKLFPAREVFEKLGFEVGYDANSKMVTVTKAPLYVTFSQKSDAYTFARMAPQKLGQAPVVIDGKTYVPVSLLTEIMGMEGIDIDGLTLSIELEDDKKEDKNEELIFNQIVITEINKDENTITVNDPEKGPVILNTKDLKIEYKTDDKNLKVGQAVEVVYGDIMTRSLPPINTPKSLKVVPKYSLVKIKSIEEDKDKSQRILVEDENSNEILIILSKDTKFEGKKEDLKEGQILKVSLSDAMTMSLPPQTLAKEISIFVKSLDKEDK